MHTLPQDLKIFETSDGSPTLVFTRAYGYVEKMHHSGGALSESLFIYHHGLNLALEQGWPVRIVSLGLGLGYNELIAAAALHGREDWSLWSFESSPFLREEFRAWLEGRADGALVPVYEKILSMIAAHFKLNSVTLKDFARRAFANARLQFLGSFPEEAHPVRDVSVVFFDAFSNKMNPELWAEDTLVEVLDRMLAKQAVLCTYAATGALNRVLRRLGFRLLDRPGFQGKRESTLAIRNA